MKKLIFILFLISTMLTSAQSSKIVFGTGTTLEVGSHADICADAIVIEGTYTGSGTKCGGPLPVELSSFSIESSRNTVHLKWETATETGNSGFEVERCTSKNWKNDIGDTWEKIGFVQGKGNSNSVHLYSFNDQPTGSLKFKYRLKQVDIDGKYKYSEVKEVELEHPSKFILYQNYPNPFNPTTIIRFDLPEDSYVTLNVYTIQGERFEELLSAQMNKGYHKLEYNAWGLSSGIYFYCIDAKCSSQEYTSIKKFIKIK